MKLNLVPATAKRGAQMRTFVIMSVLLVLLSLLGTGFMIWSSGNRLNDAKAASAAAKPAADEAVAQAQYAQQILDSTALVVTNKNLTTEMAEHNKKYTAFYAKAQQYVPSFMRLTSMSVSPVTETTCLLRLGGVIQTAQQYADLPLALLRMPGARLVSRNGFEGTYDRVLPLTEEDQIGLTQRANEEAPLPIDPEERLNELIARANAGTTGFENISNFGSFTESSRGAMDRWSNVNMTVLLDSTGLTLPPGWNFDFRVPNPTPTIAGSAVQGAAPAAAPAGAAGVPPPGARGGAGAQDGGEGRA